LEESKSSEKDLKGQAIAALEELFDRYGVKDIKDRVVEVL
jgi:hypothetical protein